MEVVSAAWEWRPGHIGRVDGNAQIFSYAGLRKASCPVIIKYLTSYLFIWLAELAFLAFLVGLYCWFFFFCLCNIFSFLKRPDHPVGGSRPPRRQTSPRSTLPELGLLWALSNSVQNRELVSVGQYFSGKPGSLLQRAQLTLRWRQRQCNFGCWFAD